MINGSLFRWARSQDKLCEPRKAPEETDHTVGSETGQMVRAGTVLGGSPRPGPHFGVFSLTYRSEFGGI